jgi:hypothetical protein
MAEKITVKQIEELIDAKKGNVSAIARTLKVARNTVYKRIRESSTLQQMLDDARETMLDNAESVLYSKVLAGDVTSLIFFLKTQGKSRGYVERQERTGKDGEPMEHRITGLEHLSDEDLDSLIED